MELTESKKRLIFSAALCLIFFVLLLRFAYLQLYKSKEFFLASEENRVRTIDIEAPRGLIFDRYGTILVDNSPAYALYAVPAELNKSDSAYHILAEALQVTPQEIKERLRRNSQSNFQAIKIERQIDFSTLSLLHERRLELPGVEFRAESRRCYPRGVKAPHLFGYLSEITEGELNLFHDLDYEPGDLIGKKGLERQYESILRGLKGKRYVQADALGRIVGDLTEADNPQLHYVTPVPGRNLLVSIDASLQYYLEHEFTGRRGGAVVLNCKNGEVIAMVSEPNYDIELFSRPVTAAIWNQLVNDPNKPLYDRMLQSLYPPGSTFKLVLVVAGLETGLIDPQERVFCPGYYRLGNRSFGCWKPGGHGAVNLLQAIEQSCDVYFYRMGLKVGLKNWADYARRFGFGKITGIDLIGESPGLVPDEEYFDQRYGKNKWSKGLILNVAIGQGDLLVTPLQMAYLAMTIANEGNTFKPHLKRGVQDPITGTEEYDQPDSVHIPGVSPETYALVKRGMYLVVHGDRATGRAAAVPGISAAGKTGTAQNPHGEAHAWFIGFAPFEDPQIAWCVFVENGGGGGAVAAPIARGIISLLLRENKLIPSSQRLVVAQATP
ncbi:MAG: penicillin-binding protein 2 [candidate division KSB1 bacterium]|nr:penicillin-binding protein 2 [candidate division KSB1 bacterium]MDZ7303564.1 penicillin-binding protein 2 [candidate division KSB1 bacterium]MDZ7312807.1 penicillin-binding protein 2 [candidate division KSB1 bacterium]